ncbi:hypothetical protein HUE46_04325 [Flavobacterium columnare]|uniref:hypothetical protein n=1 Tax=Flavobacterium columnare TaxID=996 RepID=UPI001786C706|nr:hypothetical protein [Flavobacterium columnare]QOG89299.1 hypothetical protein HUE41_04325 [Flavobacterium columnare]QOG91958.1 hypothetical protein HUE42_04320 [Flavobacterium columnare]QOG94622.1 hypothetical protein HUE43_04325 [Flavobacterium columnare]QOG97281.1 hypothetical protein HUE44_04320 [Flavobacterium columnare]QOG99939.1 hypothetical protein HUE45_04320 [Flavobacterium columnare]
MKEKIKTITKNNSVLIESYKNDFGEILSNQNDKELFLSESYMYLYIQINKTISLLEYKEIETLSTLNLLNQLIELKTIFFKFLNKKYKNNSWENIVGLMQSYDDEFMYISPSMFSEKHLDLIIQKLYKKNDLASNSTKSKKNSQEKIHFEVAVEFVNGRIYDLLKERKSEVEISKIIFDNRKFKPTSYRPYINNSLSHRPSELRQCIFKRKNAEIELNEVLKHCISKKHIISQNFIEDCKKHNIDLEL